jgi:biopolymer transport protein ExbD
MNLRPKRPDDPEINLAPLIDAVFMLLIFFMVSTTFKDDVRLEVKLPQAKGETTKGDTPQLLEVVIDREGRFYIDQEQVVDRDPATLKRALSGALAARDGGHAGDAGASPGSAARDGTGMETTDLPLLIKADASSPHQAVITLMDVASQLGLAHIAFAAAQPDSARGATP